MAVLHFDSFFLAWFAVMGAAVGSFLNVVIYRLPRGFRLGLPSRSICPVCGHKISWVENIPIFSYAFLGGRCRICRARISARYPLVELLGALLFVSLYRFFGLSFTTAYYAVFVSALLAITFIDIDFRIIPDAISLPLAVAGLALSPAIPSLGLKMSAIGAASGGLFLWGLGAGYEKLTGREGLGLGDVKLLGMIGAFLGPGGVIAAIVVSSLLGSVVGLALVLIQKKSLKLAIPYGPFLAIGALVALFWGDYIGLKFYPVLYG